MLQLMSKVKEIAAHVEDVTCSGLQKVAGSGSEFLLEIEKDWALFVNETSHQKSVKPLLCPFAKV